jgi:hypothetical protein
MQSERELLETCVRELSELAEYYRDMLNGASPEPASEQPVARVPHCPHCGCGLAKWGDFCPCRVKPTAASPEPASEREWPDAAWHEAAMDILEHAGDSYKRKLYDAAWTVCRDAGQKLITADHAREAVRRMPATPQEAAAPSPAQEASDPRERIIDELDCTKEFAFTSGLFEEAALIRDVKKRIKAAAPSPAAPSGEGRAEKPLDWPNAPGDWECDGVVYEAQECVLKQAAIKIRPKGEVAWFTNKFGRLSPQGVFRPCERVDVTQ